MFPSIGDVEPDPNGLVALGGDLAPKTLLEAYQKGIFPWEGRQPIPWFSPDPRLILEPENVRMSRSVRRLLNQDRYRITMNQQFRNVMTRCATSQQRAEEGTWITPTLIGAYSELHHRGWAHSVEVCLEDRLVGGLYGLAIGNAFFGESMFYLTPNASKIALISLCQVLARERFHFIDCQQDTPHLRSMGAHPLSREEYLERLTKATSTPTKRSIAII
jgi:leucyl/phenylalanyl-tRNA---protein transferase